MTCNAKGYLRYPTRIMTATIALVAGFYLIISGATAQPAAGEGSSEVQQGGLVELDCCLAPRASIPPKTEPIRST